MKRLTFVLPMFLIVAIFLAMPVFADTARTNIYHIWVSDAGVETTITLPFNSRDIRIINSDGTATDLFNVNLDDGSTESVVNCFPGTDGCIKIGGGSDLFLNNFITSRIKYYSNASPVSIIVTY